MIKEIDGDLISLALAGKFNVIAHGCNCFCVQGKGIAAEMSNIFDTSSFKLEDRLYKGDINKLGQIDYEEVLKTVAGDIIFERNHDLPIVKMNWDFPPLTVVNAYTQYQPGPNLNYYALTLCLHKINHVFKGKHIGLPKIGCGIAGGDWETVKKIIEKELVDCDVTIVNYVK